MSVVTDALHKQVEKLRQQINEHNHAYHVLDEPIISDAEYDALMQSLKKLEKRASRINYSRFTHSTSRCKATQRI